MAERAPGRRDHLALVIATVAACLTVAVAVTLYALLSIAPATQEDIGQSAEQDRHVEAAAVSAKGDIRGVAAGAVGTVLTAVPDDAADDLRGLLGQELEVVVDLRRAANDVAFWAAGVPGGILVVITRDARLAVSSAGTAAAGGTGSGGTVRLRGIVEPVPYIEATQSWGLTARDRRLLDQRGVYLRVFDVAAQ